MALSIATCVQNFGQFCSPFLVNPVAEALGGASGLVNVASFYVAAGVGALLGVIMIIRAGGKRQKGLNCGKLSPKAVSFVGKELGYVRL